MGRFPRWALLVLFCLASVNAWPQSDKAAYPLDSAADQARFQTLTKELRCPKCQNQSIADSNAPIASDMRQQVYQRIKAGQSNVVIMDAMVSRFGEFVRYRPPFDQRTLVLWLTPLIVVLIGIGAVVFLVLRSRGKPPREHAINDDERRRLDALLADDSVSHGSRSHDLDHRGQAKSSL